MGYAGRKMIMQNKGRWNMNKLKELLLAIVLVALLAAPVWAAGTVAITSSNVTVQGNVWRKVITLSWVADAATATVP